MYCFSMVDLLGALYAGNGACYISMIGAIMNIVLQRTLINAKNGFDHQ